MFPFRHQKVSTGYITRFVKSISLRLSGTNGHTVIRRFLCVVAVSLAAVVLAVVVALLDVVVELAQRALG